MSCLKLFLHWCITYDVVFTLLRWWRHWFLFKWTTLGVMQLGFFIFTWAFILTQVWVKIVFLRFWGWAIMKRGNWIVTLIWENFRDCHECRRVDFLILLSRRGVLWRLTYIGFLPIYFLFIKGKDLGAQILMMALLSNFFFTVKMCMYDASKCQKYG